MGCRQHGECIAARNYAELQSKSHGTCLDPHALMVILIAILSTATAVATWMALRSKQPGEKLNPLQSNTERLERSLRANSFLELGKSGLPGRSFHSPSLDTFVRVLPGVEGLLVEFLSRTKTGFIVRTGNRGEERLELPQLVSQPAMGSFAERLDQHLAVAEERRMIEEGLPEAALTEADLAITLLRVVEQYRRLRFEQRRRVLVGRAATSLAITRN